MRKAIAGENQQPPIDVFDHSEMRAKAREKRRERLDREGRDKKRDAEPE